jgi:hypothetical protein
MQLGYGQLQQLMMDMNGIPTSRSTAVSSRIRYMNRMDFPRGLRVGKGGRSVYNIEQALAMCLAFELLQHEMTPLRTVRTIRGGWRAARLALADAWRGLMEGRTPGEGLMIATFQNALDELASPKPPSPEAAIENGLVALDPSQLSEWLKGNPPGLRRMLLVDPLRLIATLRGSLPTALREAPFASAMDNFAEGDHSDVL